MHRQEVQHHRTRGIAQLQQSQRHKSSGSLHHSNSLVQAVTPGDVEMHLQLPPALTPLREILNRILDSQARREDWPCAQAWWENDRHHGLGTPTEREDSRQQGLDTVGPAGQGPLQSAVKLKAIADAAF